MHAEAFSVVRHQSIKWRDCITRVVEIGSRNPWCDCCGASGSELGCAPTLARASQTLRFIWRPCDLVLPNE